MTTAAASQSGTDDPGPVIDIHTHCSRIYFPRDGGVRTLLPEQMVNRMDRLGIDRAVLLALECPDSYSEYYLSHTVLEDATRFPERLIPFVHLDPRSRNAGTSAAQMRDRFEQMQRLGARGCGEHKVGLPIDHPWSQEMYAICGELGWPILFHSDFTLNADENGQPGLERVVREHPNTRFIGHGPLWWAEISGDFDRRSGTAYPKGSVAPGGSVDRLLATYPNLYGDLSAGSGYGAMTRDPGFTEGFVERHWRRLLLGTDYLRPGQDLPIVPWVRTAAMDEAHRRAIMGGNAARLLGIG